MRAARNVPIRYSSLGARFCPVFFCARCPRARRPGSAFLISATSSMRGLMQLPGWPTLNGGESVANCSASGMSPLDSLATVRCPQVMTSRVYAWITMVGGSADPAAASRPILSTIIPLLTPSYKHLLTTSPLPLTPSTLPFSAFASLFFNPASNRQWLGLLCCIVPHSGCSQKNASRVRTKKAQLEDAGSSSYRSSSREPPPPGLEISIPGPECSVRSFHCSRNIVSEYRGFSD